jgi:hypothetical protein
VLISIGSVYSQTIYVPSGTSGIGDNTANANVGVGTATPGAKLTVSGTGYPFWMLEDTANENFASGRSDGFVFFNSAGSSQAYSSRGTPTGDTARLTILESSGNVGIGTNSPSSTLHTVGIFGVSKGTSSYLIDNSATLRLGVTTTVEVHSRVRFLPELRRRNRTRPTKSPAAGGAGWRIGRGPALRG